MTPQASKFIESVLTEMKKDYIEMDEAILALRALSGTFELVTVRLGVKLTKSEVDDLIKKFHEESEGSE